MSANLILNLLQLLQGGLTQAELGQLGAQPGAQPGADLVDEDDSPASEAREVEEWLDGDREDGRREGVCRECLQVHVIGFDDCE